jgi:hypothetical protein
MQFRVGINIGDVVFDDVRIYGDGINAPALMRPAFEKRPSTKSRRWVVRRRCRGLWGFSDGP